MYFVHALNRLRWYEKLLWGISVCVIIVPFYVFHSDDYLNLTASLIGVSALIFVAKGDIIGQIGSVIFSVFYAIVSFHFRYWGEMITYLFMTAPIAAGAVYTWFKNPYAKGEVRIRHLKVSEWGILCVLTVIATFVFGWILRVLNTPNLFFSTLSIATSFLAASLVLLRSEYYGLAYAANDLVLIVLWILATKVQWNYFPMVLCFAMFFINDVYGFYNWKRLKNKQLDN